MRTIYSWFWITISVLEGYSASPYNAGMFDYLQAGRWIILAGISLIAIGGLVYLIGKLGGFSGLPGTLRFEGNGFTCVFPLLASIILSVVLTLVLNVIARLLK